MTRGALPWWLVVRILGFHCRGPGSIPRLGTEFLQASRVHSQKQKQKIMTRESFRNRDLEAFCFCSIEIKRKIPFIWENG